MMKHITRLNPISSSKLLHKSGKNVLSASFKSDISKLSYRQLIRIISVVNAANEAEKKEAMRFVRSITPVERRIIANINSDKNELYRSEMRKFMQTKLKEINAVETKAVNIQAILDFLLKDEQ